MRRKRSTKGVIIHTVSTTSDCRDCESLSKKCRELLNVNGKASYYDWFVIFMKMNQPFYMARYPGYNGKIVGFVVGEINTGYALVQLLAVDDDFRGLGIGNRLMKAFEKHCLKRNIVHIILYGYQSRVSFFRRIGYIQGSPCFEFMKVLDDPSKVDKKKARRR